MVKSEHRSSAMVAPPFPMGAATRVVVWVTAVGLAGSLGVLWLLGEAAWGRHGVITAWLGLGCGLGAWLAFWAVARAAAGMTRAAEAGLPGGDPQVLVTASLAGFFIRAVLAGLAALVVVAAFGAGRRDTGFWLLGWYMIFLWVEVTILRRFFTLLTPYPPRETLPDAREPVPEEETTP